jgi:serine/threonine protein kinase
MNPGDRYGRYQIIRLLGRGAMGEVFLARDTEGQREIALKIVYNGPNPEDQEILDAERLGAELQKRLSGVDRRVVVVHRYGEIARDLFIDMEYIEGEDLSAILARGPVTLGFAVHVAIELCEMLDNLRAFTTDIGGRQFAGVIHGDLKPRNIRINAQNHVKVLDFGIAKALADTRKYTMNVFASTAYCSPERLETQQIDSRSDLWSVGVLLYQMASGRLPFDEPNKERLERRIRSYDPPEALPGGCHEPLRRIIYKMLARDPARRYPTATAVIQDLARFRDGQPVLAEAFDNDATVRTGPLDDDATVRTAPRAAPPPLSAADDRTVRSAEQPQSVFAARRRGQNALGCFAAFATGCLVVVGLFLWQMHVWNSADALKNELRAERISNLDDAWSRYQNVAKGAHMPFILRGARNALKNRLVASADEIISEYRNHDSPSVYEPQWIYARNQLARALELDPDDNGVKGRLRLCEGHIERINASGLRGRDRQKKLNSAITKFEEAGHLLKHSPDPDLGLARIYVYELNDVEKGEEALKQAEKDGHPMGKRELSQLADGYRRRADRFFRESRGFAQMPDRERDYLDNARRDYLRAQDLYQQAGLFGDSARNQLTAIQGQQRVEQRLSALQGGVTAQ